jgi:branched-chain amino acid aminotransferase
VEREFDLVAFTTDVNDWGSGVRLGVVAHARHSDYVFSGAKINSWAQNLTWYEEAHDQGLDEVVLLNEQDEVCECTSANIFAIRGNRVWTPPLSSGCLPGVTREIIVNELRVPGIEIAENTLLLNDLEAADEVFITSTTRNLLPVTAIEGLSIRRVGGLVRSKLEEAFAEFVEAYVATHAMSQPAGR